MEKTLLNSAINSYWTPGLLLSAIARIGSMRYYSSLINKTFVYKIICAHSALCEIIPMFEITYLRMKRRFKIKWI